MSKVVCRWCKREYEAHDAREIDFLGRKFIVCEDDFQLLWRLCGGVNALCSHFKAAWAARK
jgi:hypothetical protein